FSTNHFLPSSANRSGPFGLGPAGCWAGCWGCFSGTTADWRRAGFLWVISCSDTFRSPLVMSAPLLIEAKRAARASSIDLSAGAPGPRLGPEGGGGGGGGPAGAGAAATPAQTSPVV